MISDEMKKKKLEPIEIRFICRESKGVCELCLCSLWYCKLIRCFLTDDLNDFEMF